MKKYLLLLASVFFGLLTQAQQSKLAVLNKIHLPNGWTLSPAGKSLPLGDFPLNIAVSSSKKYMAITNNGQSKQSIQLINVATNKVVDNISIGKSWLGIAFSKDEKNLYASGGNDNWILKYDIKNEKLILVDSIKLGNKWPTKISPAGICINDQKNILYVVTKDDSCLYEINLSNKKIIKKTLLPAEAYTFPYGEMKNYLYTILNNKKLAIKLKQGHIQMILQYQKMVS